MKISGFGNVSKTQKSKDAAKTKSAKKGGTTSASSSVGSTSSEDSVEVGSHSETLAMIRGIVEDTPDIRAEEVDRIVRQLRSGKYKIDFERVAEGFIKDALLNEIAKKPAKRS